MGVAADQFADGDLTGDQLRRINAKLMPQIEAARAELAMCAANPMLLTLTGTDSAERWQRASLDQKRQVIDLLMTITINRVGSGRGRGLAHESVSIRWKDDPNVTAAQEAS